MSWKSLHLNPLDLLSHDLFCHVRFCEFLVLCLCLYFNISIGNEKDHFQILRKYYSNVIPSVAIKSANYEVNKVISNSQGNMILPQVSHKKSRGGKKLRRYSPKEQAEIGKLACDIRAIAAARTCIHLYC